MKLSKFGPALTDFVPANFTSAVEQLFNEQIENFSKMNHFIPAIDILENEKSFEIQVSVPGMLKEDFKIEVDGEKLVVSGERKMKNEEVAKTFKKIETKYGSFSRTFIIPKNVDSKSIEAEYLNGILVLTLLKSEELKTTKQIIIK